MYLENVKGFVDEGRSNGRNGYVEQVVLVFRAGRENGIDENYCINRRSSKSTGREIVGKRQGILRQYLRYTGMPSKKETEDCKVVKKHIRKTVTCL